MRIAVSGTHCSGKSTLIDAFLLAHPDFAHEPEPYTVLVEEYGEEFSAEPSADDFFRQLEFNAERLEQYQPGARVIFERSPVDFLAYILALDDLKREQSNSKLSEIARSIVSESMQYLDLLFFLPLDQAIETPESEDPELRDAVDHRLANILDEFSAGGPILLEGKGSTVTRLRVLEDAIKE